MDESVLYWWLVATLFGLAVITFLALLFVTAPYGRHVRAGWGPRIPSRLGWVIMESPAVVVFVAIFALGDHRAERVPLLLLGLWLFHYVHRAFVFPFRMRVDGKSMPALVALLAIGFNLLNAYVNARWISHFGDYPDAWIADPRLWAGSSLFFVGWMINVKADTMLIELRKPGETGYKIPRGWLYEHVVNPNYLGELLEWIGWAIATWSLGGLGFALYTFANLAPRAVSNLKWYREKFGDDFPPERRAIIPFVW